jgi:uroporphyrinogen-III decarboxylase
MLNMGFDYIELSNSGMVTLANPSLFRKYSLPTIQAASKMIREAGQLSELHCCGYAKDVVQACHDQTDIDSINPLQEPPMGDCVLSEIKRLYGDTLCLKGNVGVTNPLLFGTPEDVERDVIRCMDAAKENGRFILFSEEGIGARTPVENVEAYVNAALRYGKY